MNMCVCVPVPRLCCIHVYMCIRLEGDAVNRAEIVIRVIRVIRDVKVVKIIRIIRAIKVYAWPPSAMPLTG